MDLWKHQLRGDQDSHLTHHFPTSTSYAHRTLVLASQRSPKFPISPFHLLPPCLVLAAYDEGLAVDVVEVQREDVVLAAHIHAVVVLILQQDAVVTGVEEEVEKVCCACCLQLYRGKGEGVSTPGTPVFAIVILESSLGPAGGPASTP